MKNKVKISFRYLLSLIVLFGTIALVSCSDDPEPTPIPEPQNIVEIAQSDPNFSTLVAAIIRADLVSTLSGMGPFTVFAPTNQAFTAAGITDINAVPVETLTDILLYHVIPGRVLSAQVGTGNVETLLDDKELSFVVNGSAISINENTNVTTDDVEASNGVIHVIDNVLLPPSNTIIDVASSNDDFSILVAAITEAGLVETLNGEGPFTVFAPTNAAITRYIEDNGLTAEDLLGSDELSAILTYHVVSGRVTSTDVAAGSVETVAGTNFYVSVAPDDGIWINGNAQITAVDIQADNGIIHVIDYVITPPSQSIAEIAVGFTEASSPQFTQLVGALARAGLVDAVSGGSDDNLTVFAPTDAAFEALYDVLEVDGFEQIPLETLTAVLTYHVVPARAFSQDLRDGASLPTLLEGSNLTVDLPNLQINSSGLIPDLLNVHATNGVIHVIDSVLLP